MLKTCLDRLGIESMYLFKHRILNPYERITNSNMKYKPINI